MNSGTVGSSPITHIESMKPMIQAKKVAPRRSMMSVGRLSSADMSICTGPSFFMPGGSSASTIPSGRRST